MQVFIRHKDALLLFSLILVLSRLQTKIHLCQFSSKVISNKHANRGNGLTQAPIIVLPPLQKYLMHAYHLASYVHLIHVGVVGDRCLRHSVTREAVRGEIGVVHTRQVTDCKWDRHDTGPSYSTHGNLAPRQPGDLWPCGRGREEGGGDGTDRRPGLCRVTSRQCGRVS